MEDNKVVNALKRLERAGSEHSRATEKLHAAVRVTAAEVIRIVPEGVELPRGYRVRSIQSNVGNDYFLTYRSRDNGTWEGADETFDAYVDGCGGYLHGDFHCPIPPQTRTKSLTFAKDVATGWLDELAAWLEARAAEDAAATASLEAARA